MPQQRTIVIATEEIDPHADALIILLRAMGHHPIRFNTADFPARALLTMELGDAAWNGTIQTEGRTIDLAAMHAIWWRRPRGPHLPEHLSADEKRFARQEVEQALQGLWESLDCLWVSHPAHIRQASFKPGQLKRAAALGFTVPRTLVTNDPDHVRAFYDACDDAIIYKVMSNPMVVRPPEGVIQIGKQKSGSIKAVYTTPITESHLAVLDQVRLAPCQFQEYIEKAMELRVTIIGDDIFVAEIHSQDQERTRFDWRHYEVDTPMRQGALPAAIGERCFALTKSYGLNYSAIDLILTPDGDYVFLEINPNGQWLWVQEQVPEMHMKEAMAACLIRGKA